MPESQRVTVLSALEVVDAVVVFTEDTPLNLIEAILPTVLIKGGDYKREEVIGGDAVEAAGGRVELVPLVPGISTSYLAQAIEKL
jgi:D-beta-D-heptose 7-phosphate kinase/D-beta-D-heptose 1-phosphate adenosyltransferase